MPLPVIIQGGMGVAISDWKLAKKVSQLGQMGVVSGTGLSRILIARLMNGDPNGDVRRALAHFPDQTPVQKILENYYVPNGIGAPYKNLTMYTLTPTKALDEITVIANFVEVFLAREGHEGLVGINLLEKVQMPNMASLYGAMLAGVDYVLMGAGIPIQIPGILDKLAQHQAVSYRVDVVGADKDDDYRIHFNPQALFPGLAENLGTLKRPGFLPIISSVVLAQALLKRSEGSIEGFIIEGHVAGGHNAPPRGQMQLNEFGEPVYGDKDEVDLEKMKAFGLPFWVAGSYGSPEMLQNALAAGAAGIQVGTAFAFSNDSGMDAESRRRVVELVLKDEAVVLTNPNASPTGFPFKVVQLSGTMSDAETYAERERLCDVGYLRTLYKRPDGKIGFRCPAEPVEDYVRKGGSVEETAGRVCLCNTLGAAAGYPQMRKDGYIEKPLITAGKDLVNLKRFIPPGATSYTAADVINYLLTAIQVTV